MNIELKNYNYNQLLKLASSSEFYDVVNSEQKLIEYVGCLHSEFCKNFNIKPVKIKFCNLPIETWAQWQRNFSEKILINENLLKAFNSLRNSKNSFYPLKIVQVVTHESRHSWQYKNIKNINTFKLNLSENLAVAALKKAQTLMRVYNKVIKNSDKVFLKPKQIQKDLKFKLKNKNDLTFMEQEYGFNAYELDANNYSMQVLNYIENNSTDSKTIPNITMLKSEIKATVECCKWNIEQEYESLKQSKFKDVCKAFEVAVEDYNNKKREQIYKHKNYNYTSDQYVLDLYPTLSNEVKSVSKFDLKEAWNKSEFRDSGTCVMAVLKASLEPNIIKKR